MMKEVSVQELKELRENDSLEFFLLDVREEHELEIANLGGNNIPLSVLQDRIQELEAKKEEKIVVMCRSGARSGRVVQLLDSLGFLDVANLKGGILAWSKEIDSSVQSY